MQNYFPEEHQMVLELIKYCKHSLWVSKQKLMYKTYNLTSNSTLTFCMHNDTYHNTETNLQLHDQIQV